MAERRLRQGQLYDLTVVVDGVDHHLKKTELLWSSSTGQRCGLTVLEPPLSWRNDVSLLRYDLLRQSKAQDHAFGQEQNGN